MSGAAHGLWEGGSPVSDDEKRKRERGKANKRNERERFKRLNAQLAELVTKHLPELPPRSVPKNQNVLDCVLLEDVIKAVKSERARLGLAMPAARADSANFTAARRGQGMSKRLRETSRARLEALSEAAPALPSPGPTQADVPALHREGLLKSETMGVMLLRVKDMHVIEGSRALDLLCPGAPGGRCRGYRNQSLYMVAWSRDRPAIARIQAEALMGLLREGLTVSVRLLRLNQDVGSGCLLAGWARVNLRVSHVALDKSHVLLTFDMDPEMEKPLQMSGEMWQRFYAPGTGVTATVSNLFLPHKGPRGASTFFGSVETPATSLGATPGSQEGASVSRGLKNVVVAIVKQNLQLVIDAEWGYYARIARDATSLTPRFLSVPHLPVDTFDKFTLIDQEGISFMMPFYNHRADGALRPTEFQAAGDLKLLESHVALMVNFVTDEGDMCPDFGLFEMYVPPGHTEYLVSSCFLFNAQGAEVTVAMGDQGGACMRYDRVPEHVPELEQTFALYENMDVGFTDRFLLSRHSQFVRR